MKQLNQVVQYIEINERRYPRPIRKVAPSKTVRFKLK